MGGLLSLAYTGGAEPPPVAGLIAASCTAPHGARLAAYRLIARAVDALPDRGVWIMQRFLETTIPLETRADFASGGYALNTQDTALRNLAMLDVAAAVQRIGISLWFVNCQ